MVISVFFLKVEKFVMYVCVEQLFFYTLLSLNTLWMHSKYFT